MQMPAEDRNAPKAFVNAEELARERFGSDEGLLLVHATKVELARHYARQMALDYNDPDVCATCTLKAWTRFREFALIKTAEEAVYRYAQDYGLGYDQALYEMSIQGLQRSVNLEISRLHSQARQLGKELNGLVKAKDQRPSVG